MPSPAVGVVPQEKWWQFTLQVSVPLLIAGLGTIGAGMILSTLQHWPVFVSVTELFILVPALMGLKGNLDMCLASRLSTQANLGKMTSAREIIHMVVGNISLVQVQATVAAFLVAWFAIGIGAIFNGGLIFENVMLLLASSIFTATVSCFVLDFFLVGVILITHKLKMNPDNLATPMAAAVGDILALSVLGFIASAVYGLLPNSIWVPFVMIGIQFLMFPCWFLLAYYNRFTRPVLKSGWTPLLSALLISGTGGLILSTVVRYFEGFVVFQPIINGVGGNLVSVQASKISTILHQSSLFGEIPTYTKIFEKPWTALFGKIPFAKSSRILVVMLIPSAIMFIFLADFFHMDQSTIGAPFVFTYLFVSLIQLIILLYMAHVLTLCMWKRKIDPDNATIPYLTATGDLLGSLLLALAFLFLQAVGHPYDPDTLVPASSRLTASSRIYYLRPRFG